MLQQELLEDVGEFGEGGVALLVELDQLGGPQPVVHVEADVHADVGLAVGHLDDGHLHETTRERLLSSDMAKLCVKFDMIEPILV